MSYYDCNDQTSKYPILKDFENLIFFGEVVGWFDMIKVIQELSHFFLEWKPGFDRWIMEFIIIARIN